MSPLPNWRGSADTGDQLCNYLTDQGALGKFTPGSSGVIDGGSSGASLAAAVAQANAMGGAVVIKLGRGTYDLTALMSINADGVSIVGNGPGETFLNVNDAGGMAGANVFTFNSTLWTAIKGLTFTATAQRTAGATIRILGRNAITATPAQRTSAYVIEDVDFEDQFNGVVINDGPASQGAWGGFINRVTALRFGAGGTYFDINSPLGGQHYLGNMKLYGSNTLLDAQRALCAIRYRGGADVELFNITSVYLRNGLLCDPAGVAANVLLATECDWDNNTQASIKVAPTAGGTCIGYEFNGGWGFTNNVTAQPCIELIGTAGTCSNIKFLGSINWASFAGAKVNGATNVGFHGTDFSASASIGLWLTGSATHVRAIGALAGLVSSSFPPTGFQIDAGCDRYAFIGCDAQAATTPFTNTPGESANRRIVTAGLNITL